MQVKGAPRREGVDSRPYFHIHTPFTPRLPLALLPGGEGLTVFNSRCSGSVDLDEQCQKVHLPFSSVHRRSN